MTTPVDVLVIGYGAVGGLYAFLLEKSGKARVTAIARSAYDVLDKHGLYINSSKFGQHRGYRPYRLVRDPSEAADRSYDYIVCTFKCLPDIQPTASLVAPFIQEDSPTKPTFVLIQNGVGIEQPLAEAYPGFRIISCALWIGANLLLPGNSAVEVPTIEHGALEKVVMGLYEGEGVAPQYKGDAVAHDELPINYFCEGLLGDDGKPLSPEDRALRRTSGKNEVKRFAEILRAGGSTVQIAANIQAERWSKNLWNAGWSSLSSLTRTPTCTCVAKEVLPYTLPVVRRIMIEVIYVARALGYNEDVLPLSTVDGAVSIAVEKFQNNPSGGDASATTGTGPNEEGAVGAKDPSPSSAFKPSMLIDLEKGSPMELEPIIGAVLDRARLCNIETARLDLCYAALKVHQEIAAHRYATSAAGEAQQRHLHDWASRKPAVSGSGGAGREAWLQEVRRRAKLGQELTESAAGTPNASPPPRAAPKVTGRPLDRA